MSEAMALSVRFDTGSLGDAPEGWAAVLDHAPQLVRLAIDVAVASIFLSARSLVRELRSRVAETRTTATLRWWSYLAVHLVALVAFVWATSAVLEQGRARGPAAAAWVLSWAAVAACCVVAWALCVLPAKLWWQIRALLARGLAAGLVIGLGVWAARLWAERLWVPLAAGTLRCVHGLLALFYGDVVCRADELIIGTSSFQVHVAPECSGYEGMGLIIAFLSAYLWLERRRLRFPHALALLPLGAAAAWGANVLRLVALVAIGSSWSRSIAVGGFHSQAGWLAFIAVALAFVAVAGRLRFFTVNNAARAASGPNPAAAYLVPFLAAVAVGMLSAAFSDGFDLFYPLRVLAAVGALWWFGGRYRGLAWSCSWPAVAAGAAVFGVWLLLAPDCAPGDQDISRAGELARWPRAVAVLWWASKFIGYLFVTPLVEELAFRGFLTRRLIAADFESVLLGRCTAFSFLGSSLAFGAEHGSFWAAGTLAGMVYALALYSRRSLGDAIVAHATTNAMLAIYVLATGNWWLWS
ncbi:MAG TPA: exosortase E/protease, VPEID-CTERM system [Pirellulales bacterium]|nr:exosortase E/protease, VPEID-CTERM system [Pirellulales bacterium]